jgi:hypothetical protein
MDFSLDAIRDIVDYNKIIHDADKSLGGNITNDTVKKDDIKKVIIYNIRYDHSKNVRSDVEIINDYDFLVASKEQLENYKEKIHNDLNDLDNPSTLERLTRTFITWTWSDDPRKHRVNARRELKKEMNMIDTLLNDIDIQLPIYRSVASATTTLDIKIKPTKLKAKYAKKIKKHK